MMSRFLASEKAKQLSHDFAGQAYLASSSQIWNDLRLACNSLLEHNDPRREPVPAWKEQITAETTAEDESADPATTLSVKEETDPDNDGTTIVKAEDISESDIIVKTEKSDRKSAKKAKKEAKKIKKAAKKEKKEKKRKREDKA